MWFKKKSKDKETKLSFDYRGLSDDELLKAEIKKNQMQNFRLGHSDIRIIGDKVLLIQIVKLLAYIRYAIKNNIKTDINVKIGEKIANTNFAFSVNDQEVEDLITQNTIEIS